MFKTITFKRDESSTSFNTSEIVSIPADAPTGIYEIGIISNHYQLPVNIYAASSFDPVDNTWKADEHLELLTKASMLLNNSSGFIEYPLYEFDNLTGTVNIIFGLFNGTSGAPETHAKFYVKHSQGQETKAFRMQYSISLDYSSVKGYYRLFDI